MPLVMPDHYLSFKIAAIDPGLNNTGIAIYDLNYLTKEIISVEAYTIISDKMQNHTGFDEDTIAERTIKLYKLKMAIQYMLKNTNPLLVTYETPFYNRFRPMAYAALLEVAGMIHNSILEYNANIPFVGVEPKLVKKHIGAQVMVGKCPMRDAVQTHPEIMSVLRNNIDMLDEHSVDAIAVGYTFLKTKGAELWAG